MSLPGVRAQHQALLRAALGTGPAVRADWLDWIGRVDLQRLDMGSTRLLPLAGHNAKLHGVPDAEVPPRIPGVLRHHWARTQSLLHTVRPVLAELDRAGVDAMLIKGAAFLIQAYAGDARLRPLGDVDLLVRPEGAAQAESVIRSCGWERGTPDLDDARCFIRGGGFRLRLHQHALMESAGRVGPEPCWADAVTAAFPGEGPRVRVPGPTSLLLHGCVYGLFPPLPVPIRWVADAVHLLRRHAPAVDWDAFFREAERIGVRPHVRTALPALAPFASVPPTPSAGTAEERAQFWISNRLQGLFGPVPRWWFQVRRRKQPFLRHLAGVFGLARVRDLPGLLVRQAAHRWLRVLRIRFD